jgi:hypothetical protein
MKRMIRLAALSKRNRFPAHAELDRPELSDFFRAFGLRRKRNSHAIFAAQKFRLGGGAVAGGGTLACDGGLLAGDGGAAG